MFYQLKLIDNTTGMILLNFVDTVQYLKKECLMQTPAGFLVGISSIGKVDPSALVFLKYRYSRSEIDSIGFSELPTETIDSIYSLKTIDTIDSFLPNNTIDRRIFSR
ncbi:hypothetical protein AVEN_136836-1 [Araneus ventricosus]|uniref:Uncharacterized protein n=1 Tax=Araneus ventricosus TaxID=182803 RepID=A0A4Y2N001_ARAVE|nr:hypothetical protein AVEN_136836-1 [Araneus ventricosus]